MKTKVLSVSALLSLVVALTGISVAVAQAGEDPAQVAKGEAVYSSSCAGCHSADGTGSEAGRPLTGIAGQEPDRSVHIESVTNGKGAGMPAFGDRLSEDEIDSVVAYVRATFVAEDSGALPRTGTESNPMLLIGGALLGFGALMVVHSGRQTA